MGDAGSNDRYIPEKLATPTPGERPARTADGGWLMSHASFTGRMRDPARSIGCRVIDVPGGRCE